MIRVIVADDEQKVCQLICHLINWDGLGMELVGTAANGVEAMRLVDEKKPDLILSDVRMPGCSGLELMKHAREKNPDVEFIIISGYSSFEYAQTAIQYGVQDYILKPVNKQLLDATLQKVRKRYLKKHNAGGGERDLSELLRMIWFDESSGAVPDQIGAANEKYHSRFRDGSFQAFCMRQAFEECGNISIPYAQSVFDLLLPKVEAAMETQLRPLCYECTLTSRRQHILGLLNYDPQNEPAVREALTRMVKELRIEIHAFEYIRLLMSVSPQASSITAFSACQRAAERAMDQRIFLQEPPVLLCDVPEDGDLPSERIYKEFSAAIRRGIDLQNEEQISAAVRLLQKEVTDCAASGEQVFRVVRAAYHLFLLSGLSQRELSLTASGERETTFGQRLDLCHRLEDLFYLLEEACLQDLRDACKWIDRERVRPINEAKQYISQHYAEPLSIDDVCSKVGFSASYFSTLFRKETGKTFLEYLADVRMEAAKVLLRETKLTMEAVCEQVGAHDYKRFSKAFKSAAGISLKEYR
ncbi:MAG: response regulator, partial [Pseudoflavonifractor sp.]